LVSYGDTARHNLVVWQKENTNDIDFYNIYRETDQAGVYEKIGTSAYNETSIFIDETADFKTQASRYRLSASNKCWESPLSKEYKTIQLSFEKEENGTVHLWWDAYEGCEYVKYTILRLTRNGIEEYKDVPANKFRYTIDNVEAGTIGFFISVELINQVDVNKPLKSESGPFVIVVSNIAELENRDAIDELAENQVLAFGGDKSIFVNNAKGEDVTVCDLTGKTIAQKQNVDSTTIPVQTAGVYIVIVGDRAFKVVVQ
ncbi:MAG: T9SS type A sorting domain-containing protein, partial [Bacteroidales bacterium]|nr:T9SS type A sorting domain-containing protein [Bacteroidales bacterium]